LPGLMELIWPSAFVVQSIHVVARLGLADHLGADPRTIDELAEATHVHAPSLRRVLRALTTVGVFAEDADGRIQHTGLSETLRADHPESVRAWALMLGAHFVWRPLGDLYESVRTGTAGFRRLYGEGFFEWVKTHPEDGAVFNAAMTSGSAQRLPAVLAAYDFSRFERIVDVGGGHGSKRSDRPTGVSSWQRPGPVRASKPRAAESRARWPWSSSRRCARAHRADRRTARHR
jgi:O-methyltransferase domain